MEDSEIQPGQVWWVNDTCFSGDDFICEGCLGTSRVLVVGVWERSMGEGLEYCVIPYHSCPDHCLLDRDVCLIVEEGYGERDGYEIVKDFYSNGPLYYLNRNHFSSLSFRIQKKFGKEEKAWGDIRVIWKGLEMTDEQSEILRLDEFWNGLENAKV